MRSRILIFLVGISSLVCKLEAFQFSDPQTGLSMEIPKELKQTWHVSNAENGLDITVFNNDDEEDFYVIGVVKVPSTFTDSEGFLPMIINQVKANFTSNEFSYENEDLDFHIEILPSLAPSQYLGQRFQVYLSSEDLEDDLVMDIHIFPSHEFTTIIVTANYPCDDDLDKFSEMILKTISFK